LPIVDDLSSKMRLAFKSKDNLILELEDSMVETTSRLTWNAAAKMILDIQ